MYRELRDRILGGLLEPGAAIDKLAICAKLGVSRFPVQAAINRLAYERLVTIAPQHGSFVAPMSPSAIREYQMIRRALECEIAELAAPRLTQADRDALADNLERQRSTSEKGDVSGFYALDVAFHQIIARPLALAHAVDALEAARTHLERMRRLLLSPQGRTAQAYAEHRALADALIGGDPDVARRAMRDHLDSAAAAFELIFRERPELFSA
ncbi:MAG: GntR family transcriptional regulator [Rhodoblastus sp.]|nr:MAG: GntR family transcriptional regulator [Rhodoblastus sp.]